MFCLRCGGAMADREIDHRLRPVCDSCGRVHYQNPAPVAGCIVEQDGRILLILRRNDPGMGRWGLPSGYIDDDETVETAAVRETCEETGLEVELTDLVSVVSFIEPGKNGLVIFYAARVTGGTLRAGDDAADARFFALDSLPDIAFESHLLAIDRWRSGRRLH